MVLIVKKSIALEDLVFVQLNVCRWIVVGALLQWYAPTPRFPESNHQVGRYVFQRICEDNYNQLLFYSTRRQNFGT